MLSVASISSRTWTASNCVLELDAANPMKTRIVAAISNNDVTAFTSESNVTLTSVVFYEIYACSWNLRNIYVKYVLQQWIVFFARSDWLLNQWISNAIHWFIFKRSRCVSCLKVPIQPCRPKSDSAPSGALTWAQFKQNSPIKRLFQPTLGPSPWVQICPR